MRPLKIGDAHGVVVEISLDREGLEWLAGELPPRDGFTKGLYAALRKVDEELEIRRRNTPGLSIILSAPAQVTTEEP